MKFSIQGVDYDEPDTLVWVDELTGYKCEILRVTAYSGHLCGYVYLKPDHIAYAQSYSDLEDIEVHGGLTFGQKSKDTDEFIFGFDCAHAWDISPMNSYQPSDAVYRDINYVKAEVISLARQLQAYHNKLKPYTP